jgi:hypothetical protein
MKILNCKGLAAAVLLALSGLAQAAIVTSGCTLDPDKACSLAELIADPLAYIQIDGARFQHFAEAGIPFGDASRIRVSAVDGSGNGNQSGNVVGLRFTAVDGLTSMLEAFSLDDFSVARMIDYDVNINSGLPVGSSSIFARFGQQVFSSGLFLDGGVRSTIDRGALGQVDLTANCNQLVGPPAFTCQNKVAFAAEAFGPVLNLAVSNTLFIDHVEGFGGRPDGMQILGFDQYFARVLPEPGMLPLLSIAAAMMLLGRRLRPRGVPQ